MKRPELNAHRTLARLLEPIWSKIPDAPAQPSAAPAQQPARTLQVLTSRPPHVPVPIPAPSFLVAPAPRKDSETKGNAKSKKEELEKPELKGPIGRNEEPKVVEARKRGEAPPAPVALRTDSVTKGKDSSDKTRRARKDPEVGLGTWAPKGELVRSDQRALMLEPLRPVPALLGATSGTVQSCDPKEGNEDDLFDYLFPLPAPSAKNLVNEEEKKRSDMESSVSSGSIADVFTMGVPTTKSKDPETKPATSFPALDLARQEAEEKKTKPKQEQPREKRKVVEAKGNSKARKDPVKRSKGQFTCTRCPNVYTEKSNLTQHELAAHDNLKFNCPQCGRGYTRNKTLQDHIASAHNKERHRCSRCSSDFTNNANCKRHMKHCNEIIRY
jgi:uncharacterized C2H2 Zn-finger protein